MTIESVAAVRARTPGALDPDEAEDVVEPVVAKDSDTEPGVALPGFVESDEHAVSAKAIARAPAETT
jgi:hypothetical protein